MAITVEVKDMKKLQKQIKKIEAAPQKVINSTIGDMKKRVSPWIAAEVSKTYGIKKAKITGQKVGSVRVRGNRLDDVQITYTGRVLTPTHFSMSPTAPKQGGSYTLKATVIKGQRSTLGKVKKLTKKQRAALGKNFRKEGTRSSDHSPTRLDLPQLEDTISKLEKEIDGLEAVLCGGKRRKAVGAIPRDW